LNFFGWIFLVAVVVFLCQSLTQTQEAENDMQPRRQSGMERLSVVMLPPYYLVSAIWAIKKRNPKYLLNSIVFPTTPVAALENR